VRRGHQPAASPLCAEFQVPLMAGQLTAPCAAWQGTSRGGADIKKIVQRLSLWGVNMLFVVGGNGAPLLCLSWLCSPARRMCGQIDMGSLWHIS